MAKWDFTGWSLLNLIRLQASWKQIVVSTAEERTSHDRSMAELQQAITLKTPLDEPATEREV